MPKIIIGLVSQAGAGKGTAGKILTEKFGAAAFTFSDILKDILNRLFMEHTRENLIDLSMALREKFGQDILSNAMEKQVWNAKQEIVIVDGIRRLEDIEDLRKSPNFHLVEIHVDDKIRYERLKKRKEKADELGMTWEEFIEIGKQETEQSIAGVAKYAEHRIDNQKDINHLQIQLDQLIQKFRNSL